MFLENYNGTHTRAFLMSLKKVVLLLMIVLTRVGATGSHTGGEGWSLSASGEFGTITSLKTTFQIGRTGTEFDLDEAFDREFDLSQRFKRFMVGLDYFHKHIIDFAYQPFSFEARDFLAVGILLQNAGNRDSLVLEPGQAVSLKLDAPMFQIGYLYDFTKNEGPWDLGLGLRVTSRATSVSIGNADSLYVNRSRRLILPLVKGMARYRFTDVWWTAVYADAIYAPLDWLVGNDVEASVFDISGRVGAAFRESLDVFLNVRYYGFAIAGARDSELGDGTLYLENRTRFISWTLGISYRT